MRFTTTRATSVQEKRKNMHLKPRKACRYIPHKHTHERQWLKLKKISLKHKTCPNSSEHGEFCTVKERGLSNDEIWIWGESPHTNHRLFATPAAAGAARSIANAHLPVSCPDLSESAHAALRFDNDALPSTLHSDFTLYHIAFKHANTKKHLCIFYYHINFHASNWLLSQTTHVDVAPWILHAGSHKISSVQSRTIQAVAFNASTGERENRHASKPQFNSHAHTKYTIDQFITFNPINK